SLFFTVCMVQAQVLNPVTWTGDVEKLSDTEYNLIFNAEIEEHWHLYSQIMPEGGALATEFIFDSLSRVNNYNLIGKTLESPYITAYDKVFEMDLNYFDTEATFTQKIEVLNPELKTIEVEASFQACDDERCIYQSKMVTFDLTTATLASENPSDYVEDETKTVIKEVIDSVKADKESKGLLTIFITAFFLGFLVLLTPCVFPMIPMTVSFFTKQSKTRAAGIKNALLYGFFIIVIYTLLGTAISALFGSNAMYEFSTGVT